MEVVSIEKAKSMDKGTIEKVGIPSIILMENAAENIFKSIVHKGNSYLFFCGVGNNGGDGLAIARKLLLTNKQVKIYIVGNLKKGTDEFLINYNIVKSLGMGIEFLSETSESIVNDIRNSDIVIDSIMGIGLNRNLKDNLYDLVDMINRNSKYIIAIDNPTGLNADTGKVMGISIKASKTFVVEVLKKGYFNLNAKNYLGEIEVVNINIPNYIKKENSENVSIVGKEVYEKMIPRRGIYNHKGDFGRVVILAGSKGMTGAAYITTKSAVKTGAGLVSLVIEEDIQPILASKLIEAMTVNYCEEEKINKLISDADVIICGPGLSKNEENKAMLNKFIHESKCPMVLDADALNLISDDTNILNELRGRTVFTPHVGEMSRLNGKSIEYINYNRIDACKEYAEKNNIVTLLKGFNTVISNGNDTIINTTGNSKMASGGMGDCLTGIIGSLIAQGIGIYESAICGAYIHGAIGDLLSNERYVITAEDIIYEIPKFMESILR